MRVLAREMFIFDPSYFQSQFRFASGPSPQVGGGVIPGRQRRDVCRIAGHLGKDVSWHISAHKADPLEIAGWWLNYDSPVNDSIASQHIRWHFAPVTEEKWRAKERAADLFVRRAAAAREGMRVWQAARELECSRASLALSLAVFTGSLARAVRGRGAAIVLLPSDFAFARSGSGFHDGLLTPEGASALTRLIRAHHIPDVGDVAETRDPLAALLEGDEQRELMSADGPLMLRVLPDGSYEIGGARVIAAREVGW